MRNGKVKGELLQYKVFFCGQIEKRKTPDNPENTPRCDPDGFLIKLNELPLESRQGTIADRMLGP